MTNVLYPDNYGVKYEVSLRQGCVTATKRPDPDSDGIFRHPGGVRASGRQGGLFRQGGLEVPGHPTAGIGFDDLLVADQGHHVVKGVD